jgi:hypothetical protein
MSRVTIVDPHARVTVRDEQIRVRTVGIQGPPGPASLSAGAIITTPGIIAMGDATGVAVPISVDDLFPRSVKDPRYGAVGDGVTDDSAAIQAAIDACAAIGGGAVLAPPTTGGYRCNVVLKEGVTLTSGVDSYGYLGTDPAPTTKLIAAGAGAVIDTPVTHINGCAVNGISIQGLGAGTAVTGIRFRDVDWGAIRNCHIWETADEAIVTGSACNALTIENVLIVKAVLNRSRAAVIGALDLSGNDHYISRVEAGISGSIEGTVQSVNLYCAAIVVRGLAMSFHACNGEFSDVGWHITGDWNRFVSCRGDLNYAHGLRLVGAVRNKFISCFALNNSQDTTNTYDGFNADSASLDNTFDGCDAESLLAKVHRIGFEDLAATAGRGNTYSATCKSFGHGTRHKRAAAANGSSFLVPTGYIRTLTNNSATPSVADYGTFYLANTLPTTITDFPGGVPGQGIDVFCDNDNTTITQGFPVGISFDLGAGSRKLRNNTWYRFICLDGASWRLVEPMMDDVSADNGDAAKTLTARTSEDIQRWGTPLTADRAVTLSTTGAFKGAKFRIVRTAAATGAFNLNVGTGPLKALTAGQWCDVVHTGSAWMLTAAGSL